MRRARKDFNWTRLRQPWRIEVPTQSVPVSPPPMTITSLPSAEMKLPLWLPSEQAAGVVGEEIHGEMDALEAAAFDGQIARLGRPGAQDDGVELLEQLLCRDSSTPTSVPVTNLTPSASICAMRGSTTFCLSSFMLGMPYMSRPPTRSARSKTVTEWPALLSCAAAHRPAGPEPTTATFLPVRDFGRLRHNPAFLPAAVNDGALQALDGDRRRVDAQHAGALARRRADAAREIGEVIGLVQPFEGFLPQAAIDQVVPLGDEVVDRAAGGHAVEQGAGVAERDAAIHAAGRLLAQLALLQVVMELVPIADALQRGAVQRQLAQVFDEAGRFAHNSISFA